MREDVLGLVREQQLGGEVERVGKLARGVTGADADREELDVGLVKARITVRVWVRVRVRVRAGLGIGLALTLALTLALALTSVSAGSTSRLSCTPSSQQKTQPKWRRKKSAARSDSPHREVRPSVWASEARVTCTACSRLYVLPLATSATAEGAQASHARSSRMLVR